MRILYIDIDSLRPDHLGCYGYARDTSPAIDGIAADGIILEQVYSSDVPCLPSRSTFFGGVFGMKTGLVNHGGSNADPRQEGASRGFQSRAVSRSFGEQLRNLGFCVASISSFPHRHSAYHVWNGFTETIDPGGDGLGHAHETHAHAKRWLDANGAEDDWFLHVNFWDPHTPYDTPLEFGHPFADDPAPAWLTQDAIDRCRAHVGTRSALKPYGLAPTFSWPRGAAEIRDEESWKAWIDGYDTGIRYADSFVGSLVQQLETIGVLADTAIVISADHGENQGELGVFGDHQTADEYTCHIPAVIRWPGVTEPLAGKSIRGLAYGVDLAATILELAGAVVPSDWDGTSFADELREGRMAGRPELILQQGAWSCQRSVRWDRYLLIRTFHNGFKDFPAVMLFDLEADPHEEVDLASHEPELLALGLGLIETWTESMLRESSTTDPLRAVINEGGPLHAVEYKPGLLDLLRQHGREDDATWLDANDGTPREWIRAR